MPARVIELKPANQALCNSCGRGVNGEELAECCVCGDRFCSQCHECSCDPGRTHSLCVLSFFCLHLNRNSFNVAHMAKLTYEEVKARVLGAHADVVDDLCQLGESLVRDGVDRIARFDSKATAMAAYSAGIVTLSMSTISLWGSKVSGVFRLSMALGIVCFLVSAWLSVKSTFPVDTEWHSDEDWLQSDCLGSREQMKRYRVLTMWKIVSSLDKAHERKQAQLRYARFTMQAAFVLLLLGLLQVACRITTF